jgi:hypothetical protein
MFTMLVRPEGRMVYSAECWCLRMILAARACSKHVHLTLVLVVQRSLFGLLHVCLALCAPQFINCLFYGYFLNMLFHVVSVYIGVCISQFVDITAVGFAYHVFASSGIADE